VAACGATSGGGNMETSLSPVSFSAETSPVPGKQKPPPQNPRWGSGTKSYYRHVQISRPSIIYRPHPQEFAASSAAVSSRCGDSPRAESMSAAGHFAEAPAMLRREGRGGRRGETPPAPAHSPLSPPPTDLSSPPGTPHTPVPCGEGLRASESAQQGQRAHAGKRVPASFND
jgi:hypothetical protein